MIRKLSKLLKENNIIELKKKLLVIIDDLEAKENSKLPSKKQIEAYSTSKNRGLMRVAQEYKENLEDNITIGEKEFIIILRQEKIKYEFQKIFFHGKSFFIADFYIPSKHIIVEIDGGYHDSSEQMLKDNKRTIALRQLGIRSILRLSNKDVVKPQDKLTTVINKLR